MAQNIRKGTLVTHRYGDGKVERVDRTTYSIPLIIVKLTSGRFKGETLAATSAELTRKR